MWLRSLLKSLKSRPLVATFRHSPHRPRTPRLAVEALDDRCLPSTFTVTNLLDSGPDSLRAAITAANANPGADEINFATTGTIALTTSGQLDITDSLTINGPGAGALTVSGYHVSRVFGIAGDPTVTIANLRGANGSGGAGGGISMAGGTVTLDHVTVSGNSAGLGGGLYVAGGTLTLDQCTVSGNYAEGGAGLSDFGQGYKGGDGAGGGLYVAGGAVRVNQSTVSGNGAYGGAGGDGLVYNAGDSTLGGDGGDARGGGISVVAGSLEIRQSSIFNNSALGGRGGLGYSLGAYYEGPSGLGEGGGLCLTSATQLADLDTFTESHTVNNHADFNPNIAGSYSLNGIPPLPRLAISSVSTVEGNTGTTAFVFTVSLSATSSQAVTVNYATADGSAAAGSDYLAASGTLTITAGQTTGTITMLVNGDRLGEANETFFVNLSSPTNATIADGQGVGTIIDDEPRISINDVTVTEGNTGTVNATFTVSLSVAFDVAVTVHYQTANGSATAGSDYQAASGTLTIPAGQTTGAIAVLVNGDRLGEPNETFFVNLSSATNATIADGQGIGIILDDEPRISINYRTVTEGNTGTVNATFTVSLSAPSSQAVSVNYATADGSATAGSDYQAASGMLTIPAGQTTGTITVLVNGDRLFEPTEAFFVNLSSPTNGTIYDGSGVGGILDDEPRISISDVTKAEGRKNHTTLFTFTVTLSAAYDQAVTMSFRTVDGTATTGDGDYVAKTSTLTFAPGETTKTITIDVKGDSKKESDETFYLDLFGNSGNSLVTKSRGLGTILNDD